MAISTSKGEYHCFWRRRVGDYRIIYRVLEREKVVRVMEICLRSPVLLALRLSRYLASNLLYDLIYRDAWP